MSSPKLPHESCLHLQVRLYRPKQFEAMAQSPVHAQHEETRALSTHVGGETMHCASVVVPQSADLLDEVLYGRDELQKPV
jgi:hypothetical protein